MVREVIKFLGLDKTHFKKQTRFIDATLGNGGHTLEIVKKGGEVLGIEADPEMLKIARNRLNEACPGFEEKQSFKLIQGNFKDIDKIAKDNDFLNVSGVIFDLGVTNLHLTGETRGFSFRDLESKLDMRLDPNSQGVSAYELINLLREDQLTQLFVRVMRFSDAKKLATRIVETRAQQKIETVKDFLECLRGISKKEDLHYATLPFLALRIAVNSEIENLKEALPKAHELLESGGKLIVISFHSLEDDLVKAFFNSKRNEAEILTENYLKPSLLEVEKNPRARSARLRVLLKK